MLFGKVIICRPCAGATLSLSTYYIRVWMACYVCGWYVMYVDGMLCMWMVCYVCGWYVMYMDGMLCMWMVCHVCGWFVMYVDGMLCMWMV